VVEVHIGPTVAQYEIEIASGTRVNKITSIYRELALALAKKDVRIEAPIPGKNTVGVEFANDAPTPVSFYEIISSKLMMNAPDKKLMIPLGKSIMGDIGVCEINKMPHMLIAGTTGSGKSVCVNGIICSILMRARPDEVKLVMVDPKVVELSGYNGIPHLMCPVVTDPKKASVALAKMVREMERRYEVFSDSRTKNIEGYNSYVEKWNNKHKDEPKEKLPYIVVIIDELSDLMMVAAKEVEDSILRITQKARAAGIHLIVATQRPSTEVITGLIKANIPSRISFAVGSGIDSRTILDQTGAEKLLGKGDMLFLPIGMNNPTRIQGSFINDNEIKKIIDFTVSQQKAQYDDEMMNLSAVDSSDSKSAGATDTSDDDPLYNDIVKFVIENQKASASLLQRRFKLGYNRAARIIDLLEERGVIGPARGSKPREVLVKLESEEEKEEK
ncbi:MAG: DNA translocase FtsK, partial [Bacilli bacterium]|nr:DNA translocase FtsK [Bacilli bacterium]